MTVELIIGASLNEVTRTVERRGWQRERGHAGRWVKPDGTKVRYAASRDALVGWQHGTRLWVDIGWWQNREWDNRLQELHVRFDVKRFV